MVETHRPMLSHNYMHLCTIALKPYKFGLINTKVRVKLKTSSAKEEIIELPIIGYVSGDPNPLRSQTR